jgi:DNA-binding NarL/FixJ family response regulator
MSIMMHQGEDVPTPSIGDSRSPDFRSEAHELRPDGGCQSQPTTGKVFDRDAKIAIAVVDEHLFTLECITSSLQGICESLEIVAFANCDECLRSVRPHDLILYHAHESVAPHENDQCGGMIKRLLGIAPVIVLCDAEGTESVFSAFEIGARGYVPTTSTTLKLAVEIMHLIKAGGTFVPPSSLSARSVSRQVTIGGTTTTQQFTERQLAVLGSLKRGKTNKIIAHELKMSESTVKVHIRTIMKKLNATNRTEVVCRAHELEITAPRLTD